VYSVAYMYVEHNGNKMLIAVSKLWENNGYIRAAQDHLKDLGFYFFKLKNLKS